MGPIDRGAQLSAPLGALGWVHLAAGPDLKFVFSLFVFLDFVANLQKSYLELGASKWGDPNFVGFLMKCTI